MDQRIIDLYDEFTHGTMGRRRFFDRLATLAGGTAAASALLPLLQNNYAAARSSRKPTCASPPKRWPSPASTNCPAIW